MVLLVGQEGVASGVVLCARVSYTYPYPVRTLVSRTIPETCKNPPVVALYTRAC